MSKTEKHTDELKVPDVRLQLQDVDGKLQARLVMPGGGVKAYVPLLEHTRKNADLLLANTNDLLLERGIPGRFDEVRISLKAGGKSERTSGGELAGGGDVKAGQASGKLHGGRTSGGEAASGIETTYHPQRGGLDREDRLYMQAVFKRELLDSYQTWASDNRDALCRRAERGEHHPTIEVNGVVFDVAGLEKLQKALVPLATDARLEVGRLERERAPFLERMWMQGAAPGAPAGPYAAMYASNLDAVRRDPALCGNASPERVATALTFAAGQQGIDPGATLTLRAGADGSVHGFAAGGVDPAASRVRVDPGNLALPTAEQVAQLQAPTPDDPVRQARMTVA